MFDASPDPSADDTLPIDLRLLREVAEVAIEVTRALGAAAVAETFHKAARALRLTLALEKAPDALV